MTSSVRASEAPSGSWTTTMQIALVLRRDEAGRHALRDHDRGRSRARA